MILVDSSRWIEYLADRFKADLFARYIQGYEPLVTSAIQVYEIYEVVRRDISEERAIESVAALRATTVEPLDESLALEAADSSLEQGLAMADAIILATARRHRAEIVTADADFEGLPRVTLIRCATRLLRTCGAEGSREATSAFGTFVGPRRTRRLRDAARPTAPPPIRGAGHRAAR